MHFIYRTWAGKVDASGTELSGGGAPSVSGTGFTAANGLAIIRGIYSDGETCNAGLLSATAYGVSLSPSYDWMIVSAVGDLNSNSDDNCTAVIRGMEASTSNGRNPAYMGDFVTLNLGD